MRRLNSSVLGYYRLKNELYDEFPKQAGAFKFPFKDCDLLVIATSGDGWDHISVSTEYRRPTWDEMQYIARMFFLSDEVAVQYHVTNDKHINIHPFCLHWWRPHGMNILLPPKEFV